MNPVFSYEGIESQHINADRLSRTLKLVPVDGRASTSYGDLLNGLESAGVNPTEVSGIFKVSPFDNSYSILFVYEDTIQRIIDLKQLKCGNNQFDVMKMTEQVITARVHWLPIYFDNSLLREIFNQFGSVMNISMCKTAHAKLTAYNGIREVRIKCDEFQKQNIPHLVNFKSGQSILITVPGRPPYCLRCQSVGHIRSRCPGRSFAAVTGTVTADSVARRGDPEAAEGAAEKPSGNSAEPVPQGASAALEPESQGRQEQQVASQSMDLDSEKGVKRGRETDVSDSWIPPNRPLKYQPPNPEPIPLSNSFQEILTVDDIIN